MKKLYSPIWIGNIEIKNRIMQCPMDPGPFVENGEFSSFDANILIERAKGGVGLIISGCNLIERADGSIFSDDEDVFLEKAKEMTEKIHRYGSKVFIQLSAGVGRNLIMNEETAESISPVLKVAPSGNTPNVFIPSVLHEEITKEHIWKIIKGFGTSAELAKRAGFDGVEVHALHEGYLLDQFTLSSVNKRDDEFGGTLENRLRFSKEIIDEIKRTCGDDYPVGIRFSIESKMSRFNQGRLPEEADVQEFGRSMEEAKQIAPMLETMGYAMLSCDNGSYDGWYWAHPPVYMKHGCNLNDVKEIKKLVSIPVYCSGRMDDLELSEKAVEDNLIDGIGLGRALLADADFVNKASVGDYDKIRPCIGCQAGCLRTFLGEKMTCALNPSLGILGEEEFGQAIVKRKIAIVGGGIGGMEFARVSAKRGNDVTIFEKSNKLGGVFIAAAAMSFKDSDKKLISWYIKQMKDLGVKVRFNTTIDAETDLSSYDYIVYANGAKPKMPNLLGFDAENVITAQEALLNPNAIGNDVVIIGGGLTGCEVGYELAKQGKTVIILECMDKILNVKGLCRANSDMLKDLLRYYKVNVVTGAEVEGFSNNAVSYLKAGNGFKVNCDTVIVSTGYEPNRQVFKDTKNHEKECVCVGDVNRVGNLLTVILDARTEALKLL